MTGVIDAKTLALISGAFAKLDASHTRLQAAINCLSNAFKFHEAKHRHS